VSRGDEVFRHIQGTARSAAAQSRTGAPTQEYLIRHVLESFLARLTQTPHADGFVLKGGILLAAYGVRRPTKDADANAISADVGTRRSASFDGQAISRDANGNLSAPAPPPNGHDTKQD
jgi:hypothetical protein